MTLYEVLGVPDTADQDTIKAAYRRLAQQHHPDKGGDPEKFRAVQGAYDVLGDPERRWNYDETGETQATPSDEDLLRAAAVKALSELTDKLLSGVTSKSQDIGQFDLPLELRKQVRASERASQDQRRVLGEHLLNLQRAKERLILEDGEDVLGMVLAVQIDTLGEATAKIDRELKLAYFMLDLLAHYDYRLDEPEPAPTITSPLPTGWTWKKENHVA